MSDDRFGYGEIGMDTSHCADATEYAMMCKPKPMTNADRIRTMTDEELADKFEEVQLQTVKAYGNDHLLLKGELRKYWLDWLRHEAAHE